MNELNIIKMYKEGLSPYEVAELHNTYPNKIRRILVKYGEPIRDKSVAQKLAIKTGKSKHPTEGRERTAEEKLAISRSSVERWSNMPEEEKERLRLMSKESWESMSKEKLEEIKRKSGEAIRKAAKEGSKLEKEVQKMLAKAGYPYESHKKDLIPTQKLEIDIYIPGIKTIIEIDGLSHFEPIWGEEQLKKQQKFDNQKDGIILTRGFNIVRIENIGGSLAIAKLSKLETVLMWALDDIRNNKVKSTLKVIKYD